MKLSELQAKHAANLTELGGMIDARDAAGVEFTTEQKAKFDALEAATQVLNDDITRATKEENIRIQTARNKAAQPTPEQKATNAFSYVRTIETLAAGRRPDGIEAEMSQEADKEARAFGHSINGIGVPSFMVNVKGSNVIGQKRDLTAGGTATGAEYIQTLEIAHQFGLEIAPKAFGLGIEVMTGLTSNVYITETGEAAALWATEVATATETTPATSKPVNLSPNRLTAFSDISKQLLVQASVAEQRLKMQLTKANNRKLDHTVFQGTGVGPIPLGITGTANINTYLTTGVPSRQSFLDMWKMLADDNAADLGDISIATTAAIYAFLEGAYLDAGSGRFVLENGKINGRDVIWSNNVASDTIIMGSFDKFIVGQWGGFDILVNPYTKGKEATIEVIINSFWDMGCLRPTAFVVASDATLS